ncbi:DUF6049 family protein [Nocardioides yefusunii]|uniref:DUF6049 family protein n=1 Tax=Nocardioides yefusunii TaxID=2500546 RepID=A0ABW1R423_9ACTN|nr:DUF6049 family protein [Nocardioides yefusunii]
MAALLTLTCATGVAHADHDGSVDREADPLTLTIDALTPSVVQPDDDTPLKIRGTVTNTSNETWTAVNVAPFRSATPTTDRIGLAADAALGHSEYVGDRLTDPASLTTVDSLAPGETATYTATIPRSALSSSAGVYWVGVHASGETATVPRDGLTDGRARTFVPVATAKTKALPAALVLPMRMQVSHAADGSIEDVGAWARALAPDGQLSELLALAETLDSPFSWLVDPAVPRAVQQLATGNRGFDLSPSEAGTGTDTDADEELDDLTRAARAWLVDFRRVLGSEDADVFALPYGDVDVAAMTRQAPKSMLASQQRGLSTLTALGIESTPVVAPVDGILPATSLAKLLPETVVLVEDSAVSGDDFSPMPGTGTVDGLRFVTTSGGVTDGGPGPEDVGSPIAVRQRTASEAVLRTLAGNDTPLVVVPPASWDAGEGADALLSLFSDKLLKARTLTQVATPGGSDPVLPTAAFRLSDEQREALLPRKNVKIGASLYDKGVLLESILDKPASMDTQAREVAWSNLSYHSRDAVEASRSRTRAARAHLTELISGVHITVPPVATLSGSSGWIGVTLHNDLGVAVRVQLEADSGDSITLDFPEEVRIAARSRQRLLLDASDVQQGVSRVTMKVKSQDAVPIGAEGDFPVRSSQVSGILLLFMGGGAALLFGAIGVRLFRRGLASRRDQGVA